MIIEVLVELSHRNIDKTFDYLVPQHLQDKIKVGIRVLVPFGNQKLEGFVLKIKPKKESIIELKEILEVVDDEIILPNEISIDNDTVLINEQENILNEENEIAEVHISNLGDDDLITPEEYPTNEFINIDNNSDEEIIFEDIIENQNIPELELSSNSDLEQEVPDMSIDDNFMTNNIQVMEEPEKQFMAINPTDIKIDEKKTLFKKKEKKEEDPLVKIMNRNIPTTLGRKCQFCSTQLGDDERICPLCGRIN